MINNKNSIITGFSLSNYASFGEEVTLDLTQNITGLYGKNACGKTSLITALQNHISIVLGTHINDSTPRNVFEYGDNKEIKSTVYFKSNDKEYKHSMVYIVSEGNKVVYEYLGYKNGERIFEIDRRKAQNIEDIFNKNIEINGAKAYYEAYCKNNNSIVNHFLSYFKNLYDATIRYILIINDRSLNSTKNIIKDDMIIIINDYIWYLDQDIIRVFLDNSGKINTVHKKKNGEEMILSLEEESNGTKKIILSLYWIVEHLKNGGCLIIDEIDSTLHPEMLAFIITLFKNPEYNKMGAKLIFTSHNVDIFDYLNKENIVIIRKHDGGSFLVPLKNYTGDNLKEDFLDGSLGSFPKIAKISFLNKLWPDD
jgi:AAA15 family ATPase/GTPase